MPTPLDQMSPLSPSGVQEINPQGTMPPLPSGTKSDPYQAVRKLALKMDPSLTRHDMDYLMHVMDMEGLSEKIYDPSFPQLLAPVVARIAGAVGRVTSRLYSKPGPGGYQAVVPGDTKPLSGQ